MTANSFGGPWTEDKLHVFGKCLRFYVEALNEAGLRVRPSNANQGPTTNWGRRHW